MTYQIKVEAIHCSGCVELIRMSLAEIFGDEKVKVNEASKTARFESEKQLDKVKEDLDKVFIELKESGYEYTNLVEVKINN